MCSTLIILSLTAHLFLFVAISPTHMFRSSRAVALVAPAVSPTSANDIEKKTATDQDQQDLESQKLALDREKFEFEKQQRNESKGFFQQNQGVILTALASLLAAFIAALVTYTQIRTANIAKTNELEISRLRNEAEDERQWRLSVLDFIIKNKDQLFSAERTVRDPLVLLMTVSFPPKYTSDFFTKFELALTQSPETEQTGMKERVLNELLSPLHLEFERTRSAFQRWLSKNLYLEAKVIREGNLHIRNTLLEKAHLIPSHLRSDAVRLVEHYDVWLEEFDRLRGGTEPDTSQPFVFVGPKGYPFPNDAEQHFLEAYRDYERDLKHESESTASAT